MTDFRFELNRKAGQQLANDAGMKRAMESVAEDVTGEMENRAPAMVRNNGRFFTDTEKDSDGWAGLAAVQSPFWHWAEFGTAGRHFRSPQPFVRPSAQSVISRMGGRWKTT